MAQEKEAPEAVIQGRLLKVIQAAKRLDQPAAKWCVDHAIHTDLRSLATEIEEIASRPAKK